MPNVKSQTLRQFVGFSAKLERNLASYVTAATAAGVGLLTAAAPEAEAKIVYTPANTTVQGLTSVPVDINHDGIADFLLVQRECGSHSVCLLAEPAAAGNAVRGQGSSVPAGFFGVPVGPGEKFLTGTYNIMALAGAYGSYSWTAGAWANVTNRYVGLKFLINGQTHYGWARLNVNIKNGPIVLTGYAYETTPNTKIIEGHVSGPNASNLAPSDLLAPASRPASLGMLARGADCLAVWRREEDVVAR
jgi:hypothetical protein